MTSIMTPKHVLLFGDHSSETLSSIQSLVYRSKYVPAARRFLQVATDIIQLEFNILGRSKHGWSGSLDSLLALAEEHENSSESNTIVSAALMCAGRLGSLICYADEDPTILGSTHAPVDIMAFCGGLLPASAVMAAKDTSQLFELGGQVISIIIRLAYEISLRTKQIENRQSTWGRTFMGLPVIKFQEILDRFHEDQGIPKFRRIAVGVVAKDWVTLIGPPSSLEHLTSWSSEIRAASYIETQVSGAIHTNFTPKIDVAKLLGNSPLLNHQIDHTKARMLSPGSLKQYKHSTLGELLAEVVEDIVHNVLHITDSIQACLSTLDKRQPIKLSLMGPSNQFAAVKMAFRDNGISYNINELHEAKMSDSTRGNSNLIAIVGMAGRFPGSETVEDFWEDLLTGKCHIKEVPKTRFNVDDFFDASGEKKNSTTARHGAWLDNPGLFDHRLFNISPREAAQMDPGHRLILMVVYEALQAAGYSQDGSLANGSSKIASYFGQATNEWRESLNQKGADIYYVPGFSRAFGPGRLNYHFNWSGGAFSIDTACSSSATAISLACSALMARECDMALAGGYSVVTSPTVFSGLSRAGMLSATGGCRTYHDDADGYARGEGAGAVVLKRLEDALSDNDNILAVIRGSARTHSPTATSMTHPSAEAQEATYKEVLRQSGLNADDVSFVEMHGTGTQAGDVQEMNSVLNVFAKRRQKDNPLTVGAVKAAMGHGEGAAGITSLIKVIMMLREHQIPPQPNWPFKLNQKFPPLDQLNVKISTKTRPLGSSANPGKRTKILMNSFDASGGNVSLAIEEAPPIRSKAKDARAWHVVTISARTPTSLEKNRERLLDYLEQRPDTKLADVAYTTTARRMYEPLRVAYTGSSTRSIISQLRDDVRKQSDVPKTKSKPSSRVFVFTGQGSHYPGMGANLFRESPIFMETISSYQEMATMIGLPSFIGLIANPDLDLASQSTVQVQLAIVALEMALSHTMKSWGITPDVVIGHSLGEYVALCVAGVLSVSDTLYLVGIRATLMERHIIPNTHAMLATSMTEEDITESFERWNLQSCNVACSNAPSMTVVSGTVEDIEKLQEHLEANGEKTTLLSVPYGFHSAQIEPILEELQHISRGVVFSKPQIPILSTLTGQVERDESTFSPFYLARQARNKVNFVKALESGRDAGLYTDKSLWIEIGPTPVCLGLARKTLGIAPLQTLPALKSGDNNWKTVSHVLKRAYESGSSIDWTEFHRYFKDSLTLLNLPTYAFDCRDFWTTFTKPIHTVAESKVVPVADSTRITTENCSNFVSTSLQQVEDEAIEGQTIKVIFRSNLSEPHLLEAIHGHVVNGQAICPLGVFQDMALTAANYVHEKINGRSERPAMFIRNVEMSQALVAANATLDTIIRVKSSYDAADGTVHIELHSERDGKSSLHGKCEVILDTAPTWSLNISQSFLVKSRMSTLKDQASAGKAHLLMKPVVYQLFSGLVSYSSPYQALQEVILDASYNDAIGTVKLSDMPSPSQFRTSPYWMDAVVHLVGFVVNSGLRYPQDLACLVTGFDTWRSTKELALGETYTVYACMQDVPNSHLVQGDCYVFHGEHLIQATLGIRFLKLTKPALSRILEATLASRDQSRTEPPSTPRRLEAEPSSYNVTRGKNSSHFQKQQFLQSNPLYSSHKATSVDRSTEMVKSVLAIVSAESGCNVQDMTDETQFADLGIDSVMAISILAALRLQLGLDLPAAFFLQHNTIGESKRALRDLLSSQTVVSDTQDLDAAQSSIDIVDEVHFSELKRLISSETHVSTPASSIATSPLLCGNVDSRADVREQIAANPASQKGSQGSLLDIHTDPVCNIVQYQVSSSGSRKLFFLADETGSTFDCIQLSNLGPDLDVYGVESPFTGEFSEAEMDVQGLANVYKSAIQTHQPSGPYLLAGVSAGAVFAFEVARQLLEAGEKVNCLLLLNCSSPKLENLQASDVSSSSSGFARPGEEEHIKAITSLFTTYNPIPISPSLRPNVSVQILSKDQQSNSEWQRLIPALRTHQSDMENGSFFQIPVVNKLSEMIGEVLKL